MKRAYSVLEVKSFDEEKREIEGIASTPTPDRMGDVVEPKGAIFKTPMPLLWQHDHSKPVGHVTFAKPTSKGIPFKATIARIDEAGTLRDRVDEAWQSVKSKLVGAVSIGFRAVRDQMEFLDDGGIRFKEWEWLELSLVTIPANAEATITTIKSLDREARAASGQPPNRSGKTTPGASGKSEGSKMDIEKQLAELEERREELVTEMRSFGDVTDLDEEQCGEYDTVAKEFEDLEVKLARVRRMAKAMGGAQPVAAKSRDEGTRQRGQAPAFIREKTESLDPGIAFARIVKAQAISKLDVVPVRDVAKHYYGPNSGAYRHFLKTAVPGATTSDATWAKPLVGDETSAFADFVEFLRPMTILGRFGMNGVPALRMVPFRVALIGQTSGGTGYWVGEGKSKPLTKFDFNRSTLEPLKVANIAVATEETLRDSSPAADSIIRDSLAEALRERMDVSFIDPDVAAVAGVSPAAITNGATSIVSTGSTADNIRTDVKAVFGAFIAANNTPTSGVWIMPETVALALGLILNPLGQPEFPGVNMMGGVFMGLPVITSQHVPTDSNGSIVALVKASDIYLGDMGGIAVDLSREASLQMDDAPTMDSDTPTGTSVVSMFQTNSVAFRAERTINWKRRRDEAVVYLTGVNWGDA
jgi:HK97 family phage prohead protease